MKDKGTKDMEIWDGDSDKAMGDRGQGMESGMREKGMRHSGWGLGDRC